MKKKLICILITVLTLTACDNEATTEQLQNEATLSATEEVAVNNTEEPIAATTTESNVTAIVEPTTAATSISEESNVQASAEPNTMEELTIEEQYRLYAEEHVANEFNSYEIKATALYDVGLENPIYIVDLDSVYSLYAMDENGTISCIYFGPQDVASFQYWLSEGKPILVASSVIRTGGTYEIYYEIENDRAEEVYEIYHYFQFDDNSEAIQDSNGEVMIGDYIYCNGEKRILSDEESSEYMIFDEESFEELGDILDN